VEAVPEQVHHFLTMAQRASKADNDRLWNAATDGQPTGEKQ
jgi:hypothetical protein